MTNSFLNRCVPKPVLVNLSLDPFIESSQYDTASRLIKKTNQKSSTILSQYDYTYDRVGNRVSMEDSAGTHSYTYDELYRLLGVSDPLEVFTYDTVGNRLSSGELEEDPLDPATPIQIPLEYTYNENNQLTAITKDGQPFVSFTYDNNGNMLTKTIEGQTTSYIWDSENRLVGVTTPTETTAYAYDPFGRRIEKMVGAAVTLYVYDREDIVAEYDSTGTLQATYVHGPGIDEPLQLKKDGVTYYYQRDGLGSITSISDGAGDKVKTYQYDSFGNIINETGTVENPYAYTGRERDAETGLYYYRARYYDPQIGRFITEDPTGVRNLLFSEMDLYVYSRNNPIIFKDPLGLLSFCDIFGNPAVTTIIVGVGGACVAIGAKTLNPPLIIGGVTIGVAGVVSGAACPISKGKEAENALKDIFEKEKEEVKEACQAGVDILCD